MTDETESEAPTRLGGDSKNDLRNTSLRSMDPQTRADWRRSPERLRHQRFARRSLVFFGSLILVVMIFTVLFGSEGLYDRRINRALLGNAALVGALASVLSLYLWFALVLSFQRTQIRNFRDRRTLEESKSAVIEAESDLVTGVSDESLSLTSLWNVTQKRLDYYHEITTQQAEVSFRRAQFAMRLGFAILTLAIVLSFIPRTLPSAVLVGALGALAAALSGYISKTFLRSQERASANMKSYFVQPVEFSRYLLAQQMLGDLGEAEKAQGILMLVSGISKIKDVESTDKEGGAKGGDPGEDPAKGK